MTEREHVPHTGKICWCRCHSDETHRNVAYATGGDRRDPIAAECACSRCKHLHSLALLDAPKEDDDWKQDCA